MDTSKSIIKTLRRLFIVEFIGACRCKVEHVTGVVCYMKNSLRLVTRGPVAALRAAASGSAAPSAPRSSWESHQPVSFVSARANSGEGVYLGLRHGLMTA